LGRWQILRRITLGDFFFFRTEKSKERRLAVRIVIHEDQCRGCRRCEMACSWQESGASNPRLAGIRIWKEEERGKDYPVLNQQCGETFCGREEPWSPKGSRVPRCVAVCLFGALEMGGGG
jgi:Fe-S-cluster-containing dehydrogenase component